MFLHLHSIHLFLWFVLQRAFLRDMSRSFATEAFSVLHQFLSFVKAHGVYVHSVWISFLPWKESFVRCICLWVICLCPSHYSLHSPPLMVEFCSPFVPVINFLWGVFQSHDSSL